MAISCHRECASGGFILTELCEGKLVLQIQDSKTNTSRVLYLTGDLYRALLAWKLAVTRHGQIAPGSILLEDPSTELETFLTKGVRGCRARRKW